MPLFPELVYLSWFGYVVNFCSSAILFAIVCKMTP